MSKALEYTKEIVVARMPNTILQIDLEGGKKVADFFETIYKKIAELENSKSNQ